MSRDVVTSGRTALGERGRPARLDGRPLRLVLISSLVSALIGGAYGYAAHDLLLLGVVMGAAFGAIFPALEIFLFQGEAGARLRRSPFLVYFGFRAGVYVAVIVAIDVLAVWLALGPMAIRGISFVDLAFTFMGSVVGNFMYAITQLLGPGVALAFAAGRYHRPRREERALLFVDLCGSTAKAERLGEERYLDFLASFIADVSRGIVEHGGEIHKYVGDEIIATWRLKPGPNDPAIVRAWASARERLALQRGVYERAFGDAPEFRAALHAGVVVVGEIGTFKKEIALIGDTMNTAARILDGCRALDRPALASATLVDRLAALPEAVRLAVIAPLPVRGKAAPIELVALAVEAESRAVEAAV